MILDDQEIITTNLEDNVMSTKLPSTFAITNDTDKYAVVVDGYYQLCDTLAEAESLEKKLIPNGIENSPHGCIGIHAPGTKEPDLGCLTHQNISAYEETDLLKYHEEEEAALNERVKQSLLEHKPLTKEDLEQLFGLFPNDGQ